MLWVEECVENVGSPLPIKDRREELGNQTLIIWTEGLGVDRIVALAV